MMGRHRKRDRHLPARVYHKRGGGYYYYPKQGAAIPLGHDFADAMVRYARLDILRPTGRTVGEIIDRYCREIAPGKSRPKEIVNALSRVRATFGHMPPESVKPKHIYGYLDVRGATSQACANQEIAWLSAMFTKAIRWGYMEANPCRGVERFRLRPRTRYVSDEEFRAVRALAGPALQIAMDITLLTGLRQGDILRLQLGDITERGLRVKTRKTGKVVVFRWNDELRECVDRAKALRRRVRSVCLITSEDTQPYTSSGFQTAWQRLMRKYAEAGGERFTFHDLRAKSASDDPDAAEAAKRLGHGDPSTTHRIYRRAANVVRPLKREPKD